MPNVPAPNSQSFVPSDQSGPKSSGWLSLVVLSLIGVLGAFDMQLSYLLLDPMKRELGLSDAQLGIAAGTVVSIVSAVASMPIGWLADRFGRRRVLAGCILFWSTMRAAAGLAYSFDELLIASIGLAAGEAGLYGIMYAMVPEMVRQKHQVLANTILMGVIMLSIGLGLMLGGRVLGVMEGLELLGYSAWRILCFGAGALGLPFAIAALLLRTKEVTERAQRLQHADRQLWAFSDYFKKHWFTIVSIHFGMTLFGAAWGAWLVWSPALFGRQFATAPSQAGQLVGIANLFGCLVGLIIVNASNSLLRPRLGDRFPFRMLTVGCVLGLFPIIGIYTSTSSFIFLISFGAEISCIVVAVSIFPMLIQDMAPPIFRSRVAGIIPLIGLPAKMLAPFLVGVISDSQGGGGLLLGVCLVSGCCLMAATPVFIFCGERYSILLEEVRSKAG